MTLHRARIVLYVLLVGLAGLGLLGVVHYVDDQERLRCQDAIEGRADLREAIPGVVVAMAQPDTRPDRQERLNAYVERGQAYLDATFPDPPCAARLGLDDHPKE